MAELSKSGGSSSHPGFLVVVPEVHLRVEDIWPDGDAPENPTAEDVVKLMRECGSASWVMTEWNLLSTGLEVFDNKTAERVTFT